MRLFTVRHFQSELIFRVFYFQAIKLNDLFGVHVIKATELQYRVSIECKRRSKLMLEEHMTL